MGIPEQIAGRCHVSLSDRALCREVWKAMIPAGRAVKHRQTRRRYYQEALDAHHENQELYRAVVTGRL